MDLKIEEQVHPDDYVGFWKRVLISFIDFLILLLPTYLLNRIFVSAAVSVDSSLPLFIQFALLAGFNIFMVVKYGGTPGKLILGVRIVNEEGRSPVLRQALIRDSFFIVNRFLAVIISLSTTELENITSSLTNWIPLASGLNAFLGWVIVIDCLFVAFTQRNRAVHDMMAGTYVVKKVALDDLAK